ncbi:MAG: YraN family protein [Lachnospiraceae bacterium]|nr:YraN family protein [Lachnospiraceae bacterium]
MINTREIGADKERIARTFLEQNNVKILEQNYHFHKIGEIDLIGKCSESYITPIVNKTIEYLVFFEVKYRKRDSRGAAVFAVDKKKQRQIVRVAEGYLKAKGINGNIPIRFDVIAIDGEKIDWIKNAFYGY